MDVLLLLIAAAVIALLTTAAAYNGLKAARSDVRSAWAEVDAALRRRYELLPPLAATVRAGGHNPPALAAVLAAKNRAAVAFTPRQLSDAEAALTVALRDLFATTPLTTPARADLAAAERRIAAAVRRYDAAVATYNGAVERFPQSWAAVAFGFRAQPPFTAEG